MKFYKFRNFNKKEEISYFCQIVLQKTMWCAKPDSLNDPEEFKFELDYSESDNTIHLLADVLKRNNTRFPEYSTARFAIDSNSLPLRAKPVIQDLIGSLKKDLGIASFTLTKQDEHLWKKYGGNGNGGCIEIEIPDDVVKHKYYIVKKRNFT